MKKSVVSALTAAVLMGAVATPAFAANPFSDVQRLTKQSPNWRKSASSKVTAITTTMSA